MEKLLRKSDIVLILSILALAVGMLIAFTHASREIRTPRLQIIVNNELMGTYSLEEDQTIRVGESNICEIKGGQAWIPAECDFSIQAIGDGNGWFWGQDDHRKSAKDLMDIYYKSVGRNSIFLMNVPPNREGIIDAREVEILQAFKQMRDQVFGTNLAAGATASATNVRGKDEAKFGPARMLEEDYDAYFATDDAVRSVDLTFTLPEARTFNRVQLQEYIPLGQRVERFGIQVRRNGQWTDWGTGDMTTIGHKRILLGPSVTTDAVRIRIKEALACPVLNGFALYNDSVSGL